MKHAVLALIVLCAAAGIAQAQSKRKDWVPGQGIDWKSDWDAAVATLHEALALDLLAEEAHRRLIRLHLDRGSFNSAIRHYRLCADVLKKELGTRPEPSTAMLYDEAVRGLEAGHGQTSCNRACASGGACPLATAERAGEACAPVRAVPVLHAMAGAARSLSCGRGVAHGGSPDLRRP